MIDVVRTPVDVLNIVGLGGLRFSALCELWGANKSGKTGFCYQTAGMFLEDYPDGEVVLIDPELAHDKLRLELIFKWLDWDRIKIAGEGEKEKPILHLEDFFSHIIRTLEGIPENKPLLLIGDTMSVLPTKSEYINVKEHLEKGKELNPWAGGRNELQRLTKHYFKMVMGALYKKKALVMLPNQIYQGQGMYSPAEISGGGAGFKHDIHYSLHFKTKKNEYDESEHNVIRSLKEISITKSRFCPEISKIPMYMDVAEGGLIDSELSTLLFCSDEKVGLIKKPAKGWYGLEGLENNHPNGEMRNFRWKDLIEQEDLYPMCKKHLDAYYKSKYVMLRKVADHYAKLDGTYVEPIVEVSKESENHDDAVAILDKPEELVQEAETSVE